MKRYLVIIFLLPAIHLFAATDSTYDSVKNISKVVRASQDSIHTANDSIRSVLKSLNAPCSCQPQNFELSIGQWIVVFMPLILFLIVFLFFVQKLNTFDFNDALSENEMPKYSIVNPEYAKTQAGTAGIGSMIKDIATATNDKITINLNDIVPPTLDVTVGNVTTTATTNNNVTTTETKVNGGENNFRPSISRYIAFFSGMLTVIIAICMSSFYIYQYIHTGCPPDLSPLSTVLIALGIGVTPYAVNKISTAISSKKNDD
ncbi:MAG: hypothetical protein JO072_03580 [Parafilimonas sp.]|nr:hypothetical protein [Parafilimonas sp.]